ncbi:MAG: hypothetical protein AAB459_00410 [Patescibacteria group bacterium]
MARDISSKRLLIDKSIATTIGVIAGASFVTVFSLIASQAVWKQRTYQAKVISEREIAKKQLESNLSAVATLRTQYQAFVQTNENIIGGNPSGPGPQDGDNARIILDALPSKYDFPAVANSINNLLSGTSISAITGADDEIAQVAKQASGTVQPIEIPFDISVTTDYNGAISVLDKIQRSIRPIKIINFSITAGDTGQISLSIKANTYYQPAKTLNITTKEVK